MSERCNKKEEGKKKKTCQKKKNGQKRKKERKTKCRGGKKKEKTNQKTKDPPKQRPTKRKTTKWRGVAEIVSEVGPKKKKVCSALKKKISDLPSPKISKRK